MKYKYKNDVLEKIIVFLKGILIIWNYKKFYLVLNQKNNFFSFEW